MHIEKRRRRYYLVHVLPKTVRAHFGGKTRFIESLHTDDRDAAELRAAVLRPKWKAAIADAQGACGHGAPGDARKFWERALGDASSDLERAIYEAAIQGEATRGDPAYWRRRMAEADTPQAQADVRGIVHEEAETRAQTATLQETGTGGPIPDEPSEAARAEAQRWLDQSLGRSVPLKPHVDGYIDALQNVPKTKSMRRTTIVRFLERHPLSDSVTRRSVQSWVDELAANGTAARTLGRMLTDIRGFWSWAIDQELVPAEPDPFARVKIPRDARRPKREAWTAEEVVALHKAALERGERTIADFIAIGAYTGMRIEEIAQLRAADTDETRFLIRGGKTEGAARRVPVHPHLRPLVRRLLAEANGSEHLFPDLTVNKYGHRSAHIGKKFGKLKTALEYPSSLCFHSLRKCASGQLHDAGVPEQIAAPALGHKIKTLSYGLYSEGPRLETLAEAIGHLDYPGLEP